MRSSRLKSEDGQSMAYVFHDAGDAAGTVEARFFFPNGAAILEDPATGSACANLGGWFTVDPAEGRHRARGLAGRGGAAALDALPRRRRGRDPRGRRVIELGRGRYRSEDASSTCTASSARRNRARP
jgi:hypothetical protein